MGPTAGLAEGEPTSLGTGWLERQCIIITITITTPREGHRALLVTPVPTATND